VVEPGRFLVLFGGPLADVEEAWAAALERAAGQVTDRVLLVHAHRALGPAIAGVRVVPADADCVGIVEGRTVSGTLEACDRALKEATVRLAGLRIAPGLGGRAYFVLTGAQHDVQAAVDRGRATLGDRLHRAE